MNGSIFRDIIVAVISATAVLIGSHYSSEATTKKADADMVDTLYKQVQRLQDKLFELQTENVAIKIQLSKNFEVNNVIKKFLEDAPYPAFIKTISTNAGHVKFTNWFINSEYERFFGIKREHYLGKMDNQVWKPDVARQFYLNDLRVYTRLTHLCTRQALPDKIYDSTRNLTGYVCQWPVEIEGKVALAGQVLLDHQFTQNNVVKPKPAKKLK